MRRLSVLTMFGLLCSCTFVRSERDLQGTYRLIHNDEMVSLSIRADHTFSELIERKKGPAETATGQWSFDGDCVRLKNFLFPTSSVDEDVFVHGDKHSERRTGMGTIQSDWCLGSQRSLLNGTISLEINPDRDFQLKKLSKWEVNADKNRRE